MAKFHNYHVLCPLIDQKSFLGVSQDKDDEYILVTLGRNVVNKYRLTDQKQISGWTSKDHITAAVIYDKEQDSYVGIFNKNTIKMWNEDCTNLDKAKKFKFSSNILKLVPRKEQSSLIIFSNGNCASLPYAIDNRKTYENKSLLKENEEIIDIVCYTFNNTDHICYVTKNNKECYEIHNSAIRHELGDLDKSKLNKVKISRPEDVSVVGTLISSEKLAIYILWTDSKMTVYDLKGKSWKTVGTVPWVSTFSSVSLAWMGKNHLILFGSNTEQDGAIIVAYNIILGVGSCRYPMKMYTENAKLYCFNGRIILEASNHIGMLPYTLETRRNLSSLLGSHGVGQDENTEIADWGTPLQTQFKVSNEVKELLKLGLTERAICSQVITPLLEKKDYKRVFNVLKQFRDVPESVLVQLVNYSLEVIGSEKVDVTDLPKFSEFCSDVKAKEKFNLLKYLFQITFSDALIIPHLKNSMSLNNALFLMKYISYILDDPEADINTDYESRLYDWCTLLMDAFYQQYLMTKDEKVTFVLKNMTFCIVNQINQLQTISDIMPLLNKLLAGKSIDNDENSLPYAIELMQI